MISAIPARERVRLGTRRTTVSVDNIISVLLSLKLGQDPGSEEAHAAVRAHLQGKLDEHDDPGRDYVSQWLREAVLLDLVDKKLSAKYWQWFEIWFHATYGKKKRP